MDDEVFFRRSAEELLTLLAQSQKKPVHQNARHLSMGEKGVLRCLYLRGAPLSAGDLGRVMDIGSGGVANLLNALEKKGYISRVTNPADRRGVMAALTEAGSRLIAEKEREALGLTAELLARLGKEDTGELIRIYRKMMDIAEDYLREHCGETE